MWYTADTEKCSNSSCKTSALLHYDEDLSKVRTAWCSSLTWILGCQNQSWNCWQAFAKQSWCYSDVVVRCTAADSQLIKDKSALILLQAVLGWGNEYKNLCQCPHTAVSLLRLIHISSHYPYRSNSGVRVWPITVIQGLWCLFTGTPYHRVHSFHQDFNHSIAVWDGAFSIFALL